MDLPGEISASKEERNWAVFAHLSAFACFFTGIGHLVGPLVIWLLKRDGNPFIDDQAKEALNFQISVTIYGIVMGILCLTIILIFIMVPLLFLLLGFQIFCMILAAVKASEGVPFRYPLTIRFIK